MPSKEELLEQAYTSLAQIDEKGVFNVINTWMETDYEIKDLLEKFTQALTEIARRFEEKEYYLSHLMQSTLILDKANTLITEKMAKKGISIEPKGTIIMATVKNDTHDLGKNIAASMLKIAGFKVVDLGKDRTSADIIDAAINNRARIIAVSAMTSTTMRNLEDLILLLKERGLREEVKVMVSGAPVTRDYADSIGADVYVGNAAEAVEQAERLILGKE